MKRNRHNTNAKEALLLKPLLVLGALTTIVLVVVNASLSPSGLISAEAAGAIVPTSDGTYTQWTPKAGSTHYTMVNETACNGTKTFVSTDTPGARDSYRIPLTSVPNSAIITSIEIKPCASRNKIGGVAPKMDVFYRWNGTDSVDGGGYALSGAKPVMLAGTLFSGLSHTKTDASTLEIGAVLTSGNRGARLGQITATLTYMLQPMPPAAPSNLTATQTSTNAVVLRWFDNATNETRFEIERVASSTGQWTIIATTSPNTVYYMDTNLLPGTYGYRIRAANADGPSAYSYVAWVTINNPPAYTQSGYYGQGAYYTQSGYYGQSSYYGQSGYYSQGSYSTSSLP